VARRLPSRLGFFQPLVWLLLVQPLLRCPALLFLLLLLVVALPFLSSIVPALHALLPGQSCGLLAVPSFLLVLFLLSISPWRLSACRPLVLAEIWAVGGFARIALAGLGIVPVVVVAGLPLLPLEHCLVVLVLGAGQVLDWAAPALGFAVLTRVRAVLRLDLAAAVLCLVPSASALGIDAAPRSKRPRRLLVLGVLCPSILLCRAMLPLFLLLGARPRRTTSGLPLLPRLRPLLCSVLVSVRQVGLGRSF
jgi:hypothetical protein